MLVMYEQARWVMVFFEEEEEEEDGRGRRGVRRRSDAFVLVVYEQGRWVVVFFEEEEVDAGEVRRLCVSGADINACCYRCSNCNKDGGWLVLLFFERRRSEVVE